MAKQEQMPQEKSRITLEIKREGPEDLRKLEEMGEKEYLRKSTELSRKLADLAKDNIKEALREAGDNKKAKEMINETATKLDMFKSTTDAYAEAIIHNMEQYPVYPYKLWGYHKREEDDGLSLTECPVNEYVADRVERQLSPEDKAFFKVTMFKQRVDSELQNYHKSKAFLDGVDADTSMAYVFKKK